MSTVLDLQRVYDGMNKAVEAGLQTTANAIKWKAKKYAPVRKIFKEQGAARMETRKFRTQAKNGRWVTREATVRTHRANRYSTSKLARQAFGSTTSGGRNAIQVGLYGRDFSRFLFDRPPDPKTGLYTGPLSSRGRYEAAQMAKGYEFSLTQSPARNAPEGRAPSGGTRRQTLIRVRNEQGIRAEVAAGTISRRFGREMSPFETPSGSFHGAVLGKHFQLQVGGALRESIETEPVTVAGRKRVRVGTDVPYAVHQEFGTRHHPAHPFMRPALFDHAPQLQGNVAKRAKRRFKG